MKTADNVVKDEMTRELNSSTKQAQAVAPLSPRSQNRYFENTIREVKERESRKDNLIIFNVVEPKGMGASDLKNHDTQTFKDVCTVMSITVTNEDIKHLKRISVAKEGKHRPIIVNLTPGTNKGQFFKNQPRLKGTMYEKVSFANDLTKSQRETDALLREDAKRMTENDTTGKYVFKVVGPPWKREIKPYSNAKK